MEDWTDAELGLLSKIMYEAMVARETMPRSDQRNVEMHVIAEILRRYALPELTRREAAQNRAQRPRNPGSAN